MFGRLSIRSLLAARHSLLVHFDGHPAGPRTRTLLRLPLYGIDASYPYFIPAPTLIGTFGAFIRIRSPITTRRALFDVGSPVLSPASSSPLPAMATPWQLQGGSGTSRTRRIIFGSPPLVRILIAYFILT